MNIKKMMTALACAVTVGFSAYAGTTQWFNGGLTADWPNAEGMNAKWSGESTNTSSYAEGKLNIVLDDNKDPLTLTADSAKAPGTDVDSVTFTTTVGFSAYEDELPEVPAEAKAGVTFVATNEDATAGVFYYLAYDSASGVESNVWVATEVSSTITEELSAAQGIKVTLAPGESGYWDVTYKFLGDYPTTINATVKKSGVSDYAGVIEFAGNGPGYATEISAEYADKTYEVTIDNASLATKGLVATNVTVNGEAVSPCKAAAGDTVVVWFKPADGMKFKGSETSYQFTMGTAAVTIDATTEGLPETESAYVSMYFFDYDYVSEHEDDHLIHTQEGVEGAAWTQDDLLEAANDPENQPTGKWFDGTWTDTDFEPAELPEVIVKDAKFVMNATNITYYIRQDFDGGEGDDDPTYEINEDESQEITLVEPTKTGWMFKGWEVVGDLPEGISIDGATITIEENAIGDVNVKATWKAQGGFMIYVAGAEQYFDSLQEAIAALNGTEADTVKVMKDIAITTRYDVNASAAGKAITLNLNDKTITRTADDPLSGNGSAFNITNGTLTITGGTINCSSIVQTGAENPPQTGECDAITVRSGATLYLADVTITVDSRTGACVYPFKGGNVYITSGTYKNLTTLDYPFGTGGIKAMCVNQFNATPQSLSISGGTFYGQDPATGDDSGAVGFLADGYYSLTVAEGQHQITNTGLAAAIGNKGYTTLTDALAAAKADDTIKLLADATGDGLTIGTAIAFDLNGKTFTVNEGATLTLNAVVTLSNSGVGKGGFLNEGTVAANADLDLSAFAWEAGGLLGTAKKTSRFAIDSEATATFQGDWIKAMLANNANFFDGSGVGATFVGGGETYNFDGLSWLKPGETPWTVDAEGNYLIAKTSDLLLLKQYIDKKLYLTASFKQTADLDMTAVDGWGPMGTYDDTKRTTDAFQGVYDGDNYALTLPMPAGLKYTGALFAMVTGGSVKNLSITVNAAGIKGGATVVGLATDSAFTNITANGSLSGDHHVAGIAVKANGTILYACTNHMTLASTDDGAKLGMVGFTQPAGKCYELSHGVTFEKCYSDATISAPSATYKASGIADLVGFISHGTVYVKDCVCAGTLTAPAGCLGSIVGWNGEYATAANTSRVDLVNLGGNVAKDDLAPIGFNVSEYAVENFHFATDNGETVTYLTAAPTAGAAKVMFANADAISLTDTLVLDYSFAAYTGTVTTEIENKIVQCADDQVNKTLTYTLADAAAKIGTQLYLTLNAAIDAANAGETVTLCANIETAVKEQWTIRKNITLDFAGYTITKTVANDWVFTVANGATVVFQDSTGNFGGIKHYPTQKNQSSPASMIQNKGNLTIKSGNYESDFCVIKNDEDPGAGVLTVDNGVFTVATAHQGYTGRQWALMNWATATINGGTWTGVIGTRSCDGNNVSKFGTTDIKGGSGATYLLFVGYPQDTTYENVPKIKGVDKANVTLGQVDTITDELELVEDGEYVTVAKKAPTTYTITITEPTNGTLETSVTNGVAAGTTVTVTATPAEGYELESITTNGTAITGTTFDMPAEDVTVAATFKQSAVAPVEPGNDGTSVTNNVDGSVTICENKTNPGTASITLNDQTTTIKVTSTIDTLTVAGETPAEGQIVVLSSNGTDITAACKMTTTDSVIDLSLDSTKTVEVTTSEGEVDVPVTPTLIEETTTEKPLVVGTDVTTKVQAIPGLTYKLIRDDAPGGTFATTADSQVGAAGQATITLTDSDKPETKAFYKVEVTK